MIEGLKRGDRVRSIANAMERCIVLAVGAAAIREYVMRRGVARGASYLGPDELDELDVLVRFAGSRWKHGRFHPAWLVVRSSLVPLEPIERLGRLARGHRRRARAPQD